MDFYDNKISTLGLIVAVWGFIIVVNLQLCTSRIIKAIEKLRKDTP